MLRKAPGKVFRKSGYFPKSEPFNRKYGKFQEKIQTERKFLARNAQKFQYTLRGYPLFECSKIAVPFVTGNFRKLTSKGFMEWKVRHIYLFQK